MTDEGGTVSPDMIAFLRLILSYSCGFYELQSDDTDPFQKFAAIQCTDCEYLKNVFVTLLQMTREQKNRAVETKVKSEKEIMALEKDPTAVTVLSKGKSENEELLGLDEDLSSDPSDTESIRKIATATAAAIATTTDTASLDLSFEGKEKAERRVALPKGLSIVCGDLQKVDKEFLLLKREIASVSFETQSSAMYKRHSKLQVLYIGFTNTKYDFIRIYEDLIEPGQNFENSFRTVFFILGDPEKSSIPRKSIPLELYPTELYNDYIVLENFDYFHKKWEFSTEKLDEQIKDILNKGLPSEDPD